jgi:hypothetical protein
LTMVLMIGSQLNTMESLLVRFTWDPHGTHMIMRTWEPPKNWSRNLLTKRKLLNKDGTKLREFKKSTKLQMLLDLLLLTLEMVV